MYQELIDELRYPHPISEITGYHTNEGWFCIGSKDVPAYKAFAITEALNDGEFTELCRLVSIRLHDLDINGPVNVEYLRKLAAAATPGPWHVVPATGSIFTSAGILVTGLSPTRPGIASKEDADYIAAVNPGVLTRLLAPQFKVRVVRMTESHQVTYWVYLTNADRPVNPKWSDSAGLITPFKHTNLDYANQEAADWAEFLGVEFTPYVDTIDREAEQRAIASAQAAINSI